MMDKTFQRITAHNFDGTLLSKEIMLREGPTKLSLVFSRRGLVGKLFIFAEHPPMKECRTDLDGSNYREVEIVKGRLGIRDEKDEHYGVAYLKDILVALD